MAGVITTLATVHSEFQREVVDTGRLASFLFFVALLGTFGFIRTSTWMIHKQVSWWPGNVSVGGTHVHHLVWGICAMMIFGYLGVVHQPDSPWREIVTVLFGVGMGLTLDEFRQIQSHVDHTFQFLSQIPWTKELRRIPEIARSHHEKLDGSGYPSSKRALEIPVQTRMMTIADIFDALTAADRPYKAALPVTAALDVLTQEARRGALDVTLLNLFISISPWSLRKH